MIDFGNDIFKMTTLTDAINKIPFVPSRIGQLGIFQSQGVPTTSIVIEERKGILALLQTKRRGEPGLITRNAKRKTRSFAIPHIPYDDEILAESIQNVREFGSEDQMQAVVKVIADKLAEMRQSHEATLEFHRCGALNGIILDADASTIFNLFTEFGITQQTLNFALGTATTDVRKKCTAMLRFIEKALGNAGYTGVRALCGSDFFDALIGAESVKAAYYRYQDSVNLRNDPRNGFEFGGITFEEYRGKVDTTQFVGANTARFFPVGVPNLFKTYFAPADFIETVNTIGLPYYAKSEPMKFNRGVEIHTQSNPLCLCTMPGVLVAGTNT